MVEMKHAVFVLPIIGGILAFIGSLLPWAQDDISGVSIIYSLLYFMYDFGPYGSETLLLSAADTDSMVGIYVSSDLVALSTMVFALILIMMIVMILLGVLALLEKLKGKIIGVLLLIVGVITLISPFIYYFGVISDTSDFFEFFPIAIGYYMPIIGGIITIAAGVLAALKLE